MEKQFEFRPEHGFPEQKPQEVAQKGSRPLPRKTNRRAKSEPRDLL